MTPQTAKSDPPHLELASDLARALGTRRSQRLQALMRDTHLPPEVILDLALELVDIAAKKLAPPPIRRFALGLGAARWRNVSAKERSEILRRAAQARWAKYRKQQKAAKTK
jgi:hypothetical protein